VGVLKEEEETGCVI